MPSPSRLAAPAVLLFCACTPALQQDAPPPPLRSAVLDFPDRTVEVVGLERWTPEMIQDSFDVHAPGTTLASGGCAAVLRYELGFAEAAVTQYAGDAYDRPYVVVRVVEPHDSARVRHRDVPMDTSTADPEWPEGTRLLREAPGALFSAVQWHLMRDRVSPEVRMRGRSAAARAATDRAHAWLYAHASGAERERALRVLRTDPHLHDRTLAAALLLNFGRDDETWHALVETMREPDGPAKGMAGIVLKQLAEHRPRTVAWTPAAESVHAMLDGTSLFELGSLMHALARTGAGPDDARPFLAGGGRMVLAYLRAEHPPTRQAARDLLVALRGNDLGDDPAAWEAWVRSL